MEEEFVLTGDIEFVCGDFVMVNDKRIGKNVFFGIVNMSGDNERINDIIDDVSYVGYMKHSDFEKIFPDNLQDLEKTHKIVKRMDSTNRVEFYRKYGFKITI